MTEERELVYGVHPVLELLDAKRRQVERIFVSRTRRQGVGRVLRLARQAGVPVSHLSREALAHKAGVRAAHQGIAAQVAGFPYEDADALCREAAEGESALLVLVDRVTDPRNLGSILRTCAAAGVAGVILGGEGSAGLGPTVAKTSAGAIERIRVAREARPARRLTLLKEAGFACVALDPRGSVGWDHLDFGGRIIIVAGGEGRGLRPGITRACDRRVAIPMAPGVESLNVSVALGVLLFEVVRQQRAGRSRS